MHSLTVTEVTVEVASGLVEVPITLNSVTQRPTDRKDRWRR